MTAPLLLHVDGSHLKDSSGDTVTLHGFVYHGLGWYDSGGVLNENQFVYMAEWGANCVVMQLQGYTMDTGRASYGGALNCPNFLTKLDDAVGWAQAHGLHVILRMNCDGPCTDNVHIRNDMSYYMVNDWSYSDWISTWAILANRYKNKGLIYAVIGEPLHWAASVAQAQMQACRNAITSADPTAIVLCPAYCVGDWDTFTMSTYLSYPISGSNVIYGFDDYAYHYTSNTQSTIRSVRNSDGETAFLATGKCIVCMEMGDEGNGVDYYLHSWSSTGVAAFSTAWLNNFMAVLDADGYSGFMAWSWRVGTGSDLLSDWSGTANGYGDVVKTYYIANPGGGGEGPGGTDEEFSNGFEEGDFSAWTSTSVSGQTVVDSYSEANQDDYGSIRAVHPSGDAYPAVSARMQSFMAPADLPLTSCKFYLKKVGSPVGNLKAALYAHSGTFGSTSVASGNALATSVNSVAMASLSDVDYGLFEFTFNSAYLLTTGTYYVIAVYASDATTLDTTTNYVLCGVDGSSPSHGGNSGLYASDAWAYDDPTGDMCFYVYSGSSTNVLEVESGHPKTGTYNARVVTDGTPDTTIMCSKTVALGNLGYHSAEIKFNQLNIAFGEQIDVLWVDAENWTTQVCASVKNDAGVLKWAVKVGNTLTLGTHTPVTGTWYNVKILRDLTNGLARLWIDSVEEASAAASVSGSASTVRCGVWQSGAGIVEAYFDDVEATYYAVSLPPVAAAKTLTRQLIMASGTLAGAGVQVSSAAAFSADASHIDWGTIVPGASKTATIQFVNRATGGQRLKMAVSAWNISQAQNVLTCSWNQEGTVLMPGEVCSAILTLSAQATAVANVQFSFTISIMGTTI